MSFLAGLPSEFDAAKAQILSSSEIPSLQDVFTRILRTEITFPQQPTSALISWTNGTKNGKRGGGTNRNSDNRDSGIVFSYNCHELGHTKQFCKKLQNKNQCNQSANVALINANPEKLILVSADEFAKFTWYPESLKASTTPVTAFAGTGKTNTCLLSSSSKWVIDSGATDHMTERKNRHFLETARALQFQMQVPKSFWAIAVSTACVLFNCMPPQSSMDILKKTSHCWTKT